MDGGGRRVRNERIALAGGRVALGADPAAEDDVAALEAGARTPIVVTEGIAERSR
jgi:hypothetical protein